MRRIARLERSIGLFQERPIAKTPSLHLSSSGKNRTAAPFSTSPHRAASTPFSEKVRRKIWGTDKPPGLPDPYGKGSKFDKTEEGQTGEEALAVYEGAKDDQLQGEEEPELPGSKPSLDDYDAADTWDGLEWVGDDKDKTEYFWSAFFPRKKATSDEEITLALRRALIEVFALQEAGKPLEFTLAGIAPDNTHDVQINPQGDGVTLQFTEYGPMDDIVRSIEPTAEEIAAKISKDSGEETAEDNIEEIPNDVEEIAQEDIEEIKPAETEKLRTIIPQEEIRTPLYDELFAHWGSEWLQISLERPGIKFAVMKRVLQLTGVRTPDSVIKSSTTVQKLLSYLTKPVKATKLVEDLAESPATKLTNVSVYPRRLTKRDQHQAAGRWKIITQELQKNDDLHSVIPVSRKDATRL